MVVNMNMNVLWDAVPCSLVLMIEAVRTSEIVVTFFKNGTISQKTTHILKLLQKTYPGKIYPTSSSDYAVFWHKTFRTVCSSHDTAVLASKA